MRERFYAFSDRRLEVLRMNPGTGQKEQLTQLVRSTILTLLRPHLSGTPGKLTYELPGVLAAHARKRNRRGAGLACGRASARHRSSPQPCAAHRLGERRREDSSHLEHTGVTAGPDQVISGVASAKASERRTRRGWVPFGAKCKDWHWPTSHHRKIRHFNHLLMSAQ